MAKLIACAGEGIELSGVPTEIKILPLGRVHSQKGDFNVDEESFELIRKQFKDRKLDLVIDYEHQTLSDVQAPAGGWIKELYKGEDAIIAKVEWTAKAAEYLKNKEYRYLSPVVLVRKRDQKATAIHSVALTNTPAIDGMFALVNSLDIEDISEGGNIMDLKELAKALGLPETATEEEIKKAVEDAAKAAERLKEMEEKKPEDKPGEGGKPQEVAEVVANSTILSMLGLKEGAKTEDVAASIMALKTGTPDTQAELLALKQRMQERDADEEVQKALKAGKITAAQSGWAKSYALKDMDGFKGFVEKAPVVVPPGKLELKDAPAAPGSDEVDVAILKNMGVSMEDVKKYGGKED
ncbi:MAG: phage protease [[Clostridium] symbiosum]|jgi:Mu-like prophage I protein